IRTSTKNLCQIFYLDFTHLFTSFFKSRINLVRYVLSNDIYYRKFLFIETRKNFLKIISYSTANQPAAIPAQGAQCIIIITNPFIYQTSNIIDFSISMSLNQKITYLSSFIIYLLHYITHNVISM